jgi:hypothetical protein
MTKYPRNMALAISKPSMSQAEMPMVALRSEKTCKRAPEIFAKSEFTAYSRINSLSFHQVARFCKWVVRILGLGRTRDKMVPIGLKFVRRWRKGWPALISAFSPEEKVTRPPRYW